MIHFKDFLQSVVHGQVFMNKCKQILEYLCIYVYAYMYIYMYLSTVQKPDVHVPARIAGPWELRGILE